MILYRFNWQPSETLFEIGDFGIHIYSLMFIVAFGLGYIIMRNIYKNENVKIAELESLFTYMVIAVLLGARIGDVFFYSWDYYKDHLIEILLPIRENPNASLFFGLIDGYAFSGYKGLASHGAVIGVLVGLWLYQIRHKYQSFIWLLDRITIPITIGGCFVRIGNFFNSEIVGKYTNTDFGVVFINNNETLPRHPAQLYEVIGYFILWLFLRRIYKTDKRNYPGYLIGVMFTGMFTIRFIIEFVKEKQGGIEDYLPGLSTGQWLSIPLIIVGIYLIIRSIRKGPVTNS
ncbi:MAG: prolipoprotein diacylglyceryl transferase [Flavobacteriaceae bacterium]|nr:prolipoprotein diacylglyceryl transferase [Flavobacteriaceae bacterium]